MSAAVSALLAASMGAAAGALSLELARTTLHSPGPLPFPSRTVVGAVAGSAALVGLDLRTEDLGVLAFYAATMVVLFAVSLVDLIEGRIPNCITGPAVAIVLIGLTYGAVSGHAVTSATPSAAASIVFGGTFLMINRVRPAALGLGDVKLALFLGLALGWDVDSALQAIARVGWSITIAAGLGLLYAAARRARRIPFGPALSLATWLVLVAGVSL